MLIDPSGIPNASVAPSTGSNVTGENTASAEGETPAESVFSLVLRNVREFIAARGAGSTQSEAPELDAATTTESPAPVLTIHSGLEEVLARLEVLAPGAIPDVAAATVANAPSDLAVVSVPDGSVSIEFTSLPQASAAVDALGIATALPGTAPAAPATAATAAVPPGAPTVAATALPGQAPELAAPASAGVPLVPLSTHNGAPSQDPSPLVGTPGDAALANDFDLTAELGSAGDRDAETDAGPLATRAIGKPALPSSASASAGSSAFSEAAPDGDGEGAPESGPPGKQERGAQLPAGDADAAQRPNAKTDEPAPKSHMFEAAERAALTTERAMEVPSERASADADARALPDNARPPAHAAAVVAEAFAQGVDTHELPTVGPRAAADADPLLSAEDAEPMDDVEGVAKWLQRVRPIPEGGAVVRANIRGIGEVMIKVEQVQESIELQIDVADRRVAQQMRGEVGALLETLRANFADEAREVRVDVRHDPTRNDLERDGERPAHSGRDDGGAEPGDAALGHPTGPTGARPERPAATQHVRGSGLIDAVA